MTRHPPSERRCLGVRVHDDRVSETPHHVADAVRAGVRPRRGHAWPKSTLRRPRERRATRMNQVFRMRGLSSRIAALGFVIRRTVPRCQRKRRPAKNMFVTGTWHESPGPSFTLGLKSVVAADDDQVLRQPLARAPRTPGRGSREPWPGEARPSAPVKLAALRYSGRVGGLVATHGLRPDAVLQSGTVHRRLHPVGSRARRIRQVEHIVCDGGSTDDTLDVLRRRTRLRSVGQRAGQGAGERRQHGDAAEPGEILGWLNSDDAYFDRRAIEAAVDVFDATRGRRRLRACRPRRGGRRAHPAAVGASLPRVAPSSDELRDPAGSPDPSLRSRGRVAGRELRLHDGS